MADESLSLYESWDLQIPPCPPHSRLYHLAPVGVGTPDVESLTSYVSRLALAHGVSLRVLTSREIIPHLQRSYLVQRRGQALGAFWRKDVRALNGTEATASDWVQALTTLTLRRDLRYLTLLTWASVLPSRGLLRPTQAWCPCCFDDWRAEGRVIYLPLLWAVAAVTACRRHRRLLQDRCPHPACRQRQFLLTTDAEPGYCGQCGHWLGTTGAATGDDTIDEDTLAWQSWVVEAVGALLATAPTQTDPPQREDVVTAIRQCVERVGGVKKLSRAVQVHVTQVAQWQRAVHIPCLPWLLHLCYRLGTTPLPWLTDRSIIHTPTAGALPSVPVAPRRPRNSFDIEGARARLQAVLSDQGGPPPSTRAIARHLGCQQGALNYHFPEECRAVSARYLAHCRQMTQATKQLRCDEVRQVTTALHAQGVYPSFRRVAAQLRHQNDLYRAEAQAAWHATLRDLGWEA
jgi:DNA-binding transcriptional regulator YdaS (Cro superfamily)